MKQTWPYLLLVIALFLGINAPSLFSEGMFMDGLFYSTISRNLAEGKGTFWDLYYTETYNYHFFGHPPLAMGIESLFYRIFGDYLFVDRIYSLTFFFLSSFLIVKIWFLLNEEKYRKLFWFPLLLHSIIGVVGWSVSNNILENTMTFFVLLSFYLIVLSFKLQNLRFRSVIIFGSGLVLYLAFLTKGVVGIFPLSSFVIYFLLVRKISIKRTLFDTTIMTLGLLIPFFAILFFNTAASEYLKNYYEAQILHSLTKVNIISSRLWILWSLFQQLIPTIVLSLVLYLIAVKMKITKINKKPYFLFVLTVGLCGVLPMMISLKQRDFYIVSAYPFFTIAIALFLKDHLLFIINKLQESLNFIRFLKVLSISLLLTSFIIIGFQKDRIGRDVTMIRDIKKIKKVIPEKSIITIPLELSQDWALRGYFARYHSVGLTFEFNENYHYYLSTSREEIDGYKRLDHLDLEKYNLYSNLVK